MSLEGVISRGGGKDESRLQGDDELAVSVLAAFRFGDAIFKSRRHLSSASSQSMSVRNVTRVQLLLKWERFTH